MNCLICVVGCFFVITAINGDNYNNSIKNYEPNAAVVGNSFSFGYKWLDKLNMRIDLKNIPMHVTHYRLFDREYLLRETQLGTEYLINQIQKGTQVKQESLTIHRSFMLDKAWYYIQLWTEGRLCATKTVFLGEDVSISHHFQYNDVCILTSSDSRPCLIEVDFNNECEENPMPAVANCYQDAVKMACTTNTTVHDIMTHQWMQYGFNGSLIGPIPWVKATTTRLIFKLELFDNNSYVYNTLTSRTSLHRNVTLSSQHSKIIILPNETKKDFDVTTLRYSESKDVHFNCQEYFNMTSYIQIGLINNTMIKIIKFNDTKEVRRNFKMADNGIILCCLVYVVQYEDDGMVVIIERFVKNKTLLVYYDENESSNIKPLEHNDKGSRDSIIIIMIITSAVAIILVVVLIIVIILKKRCWKKTYPPQRPQMPIAPSNFYLNLLFRRQCQQEIDAEEEHYYEEVD